MKSIHTITFLSLFLISTSCFKKSEDKENMYFNSDKFYNNLIKNVEKMDSRNKYYYVFIFSDTLVLTNVKDQNGCFPCGESRKLGSFVSDQNKIILTQPINPKYNLIKEKNSLDKNPMLISTKEKVDRNPEGLVFKMTDSENLKQIYTGKISNFLKKEEYKFQIKD